MRKILTAVIATTFVLGSASGFAADAAKKPELTQTEKTEMRDRAEKLAAERAKRPVTANKQELTQEERTELRNRAAKLAEQRAVTPVPAKSTIKTSTKSTKSHINKSKQAPTTDTKQGQPKI
jgi:hypothetical protein